jgi:hypothetical protein
MTLFVDLLFSNASGALAAANALDGNLLYGTPADFLLALVEGELILTHLTFA